MYFNSMTSGYLVLRFVSTMRLLIDRYKETKSTPVYCDLKVKVSVTTSWDLINQSSYLLPGVMQS